MNDKSFPDKRFDYFLDKVIINESKLFYKRQMKLEGREKIIIDNEDFSSLFNKVSLNGNDHSFDMRDTWLDVNNALKKLSAIEQTVIFLLFKEDMQPDDAAQILEICSKSVSRIKLRAIGKLKNYLEDDENEK